MISAAVVLQKNSYISIIFILKIIKVIINIVIFILKCRKKTSYAFNINII